MRQNPLTVIAPIRPDRVESVKSFLDDLGRDLAKGDRIRFDRMRTLHFAAWLVIPGDAEFAPQVVLETSYDGTLDDHLNDLLTHGRPALKTVFANCERYSARSNLGAYLRRHAVPTASFHAGFPGQTVDSIQNAIAVRQEIQRFVDAELAGGGFAGLSAQAIQARIAAHLEHDSPVAPLPSPVTLEEEWRLALRNAIAIALLALPLGMLLSPAFLAYLVLLRRHEIEDPKNDPPPPLIDPRLYRGDADLVQNHMATVVPLRPGALRRWTLKGMLWTFGHVGRWTQRTGDILGISTIHFVRWALSDDERRLVFLANYDGTWFGYLGDFVDSASFVLTSIWGNTRNFPPSQWLFWGGARHAQGFDDWTRHHNVYTPVFYSAYPGETVRNLHKDIELRDRISLPLSAAESEKLLGLL